MPPIHLMSATNEVRSGLVLPQQLPLKLATTSSESSVTARRPRWTSGSPAGVCTSRSPSENTAEPQPVFEDPEETERPSPDQQLSPGSTGETTGPGDQCRSTRTAALSPTNIVLRQNSTTTRLISSPGVSQQSVATSTIMTKSSPAGRSFCIFPFGATCI